MRRDYQLPLPLECHSELSTREDFSKSAVGTPLRTQNATYSSVRNPRAASPADDPMSEFELAEIFQGRVLEALSAASQLVLSFQGMATAFHTSKIDGAVCSNRKIIEASTRASQEASALTPRIGASPVEPGGDMYRMPQDGA